MKNLIKLILVFNLVIIKLSSQTCGGFTKLPNSTKLSSIVSTSPTNSFLIKDRFGNSFDIDEVRRTSNTSSANLSQPLTIQYYCTAGLFNIEFIQENSTTYGFADTVYREIICQVFTDISRMLHDVNPSNQNRVNIVVGSENSILNNINGFMFPPGVDVIGSGFDIIHPELHNAFIDNSVFTTIKGGQSAYKNLNEFGFSNSYFYYHGYLVVNFSNNNWYTNLYSKAIPSSKSDLYSAVLHEALHMLGLSSYSDQNSLSTVGSKLYSRYDNFLYKSITSNKLFNQNPTNFQITAPYSNLALNCSSPNNIIFNGNALTNQSVFSNSVWKSGVNLSHFGCSGTGFCNPVSYAKPSNLFVLTPCKNLGASYLKRHPHQNEVYALCDLGYKLKSISGVIAYGDQSANDSVYGDIYQTYNSCTEPCISIGINDSFNKPFGDSFVINYSTILANDYPSTSIIGRIHLLDTSLGSMSIIGSSIKFKPNKSKYVDEVILVYYPKCGTSSSLGNATYITINYNYSDSLECIDNGECNYICNGTFEETNNPNAWSNFVVWAPTAVNTVDLYKSHASFKCRRDHIQNYWHGCDEDSLCHFNTKSRKPDYYGGKQFIGMGSSMNYAEGIHFKLKKPIYYDTTKSFELKFKGNLAGPACLSTLVYVMANDSPPPKRPNPLFTKTGTGGILYHTGYDSMLGVASIGFAPVWGTYKIQIPLPNPGDSFTDIVVCVFLDTIVGEPADRYAYLDNFELYDLNAPKVEITSNPSTVMPCTDTSHSILYTVCLKNSVSLNSDSIFLKLDLPSGVSLASGSSFNALGIYKIPPGTISDTTCINLTLKYNITPVGTNATNLYDIKLGNYSNLYCKEEVSSLIKVYPINNSITINRYVSDSNPKSGDTVIFYTEICNTSLNYIDDLDIFDTIPTGVTIIDGNGFYQNGNVLSRNISISGKTASVPFCHTYSYSGIVTSNCKITSKVNLSSGSNPCFKAQGNFVLNNSNSGSPIDATISPNNAIWCGVNTPLNVNITNPIGTYTYQWLRNDTNISGATNSNYLVTNKGKYTVEISKGGCKTIVSKQLDSGGLILSLDSTLPRCTSSTGKISIRSLNGVRPFIYSWSSLTGNDSIKNNLVSGTYTITITDSIGCSKVKTFNLTSKVDTLSINKLESKPMCTSSNGEISISVSGGTPKYSYLWNTSAVTKKITNLNAGTYSVIVSDSFGCKGYDTTILTSDTLLISSNDSIVDNICLGSVGKIFLKPTGGTAPYKYLWNNGDTLANHLKLKSGNYNVTITDSNGCVRQESFYLAPNFQTLTMKDSIIHIGCNKNKGAIYITPLTGTAPYTYKWGGIAGSNAKTNLSKGTYNLEITDTNFCTVSKSIIVDSLIYNLSIKDSIISATNCASGNGIIYLTPLNGQAPYTYQWSNGTTAQNLILAEANTYFVTITDARGCQAMKSYTVGTQVPNTVDGYIKTYTNCDNGTAIMEVVMLSDTNYLTYKWSTGSTSKRISSNLLSSNYSVTITDVQNCKLILKESPHPDSFLKLGAAYGSPNYSAISNSLTNNILKKNIRIGGIFKLDNSANNINFKYCDFILDPGASIVFTNGTILVSTPITTNFYQNNIYTCTNQLARGFTVDTALNINLDTKINFERNEIRDCYKAMEINSPVLFKSSNNLYENNFYGVHYIIHKPWQYLSQTIYQSNFGGDTIRGHKTLPIKAPFTGLTKDLRSNLMIRSANVSTYTTPYVGILTEKMMAINIGDIITNKKLHLENLHYGIVGADNSFIVQNVSMQNIKKYGVYNESGIGVYGINSTPTINNNTIANSNYGIKSIGTGYINISGNSISTVDRGIEVINDYSSGSTFFNVPYKINNNQITAKKQGLFIQNNLTKPNPCNIYSNTINIANATGTWNNGVYIQNNLTTTTGFAFNFYSNTVTCGVNTTNGILLTGFPKSSALKSVVVRQNTVNLNSPTTARAGINYNNSAGLFDTMNTVYGVASLSKAFNPSASLSPRIYPIGISYEASTGTYACNAVHNMRTGVNFFGDCFTSTWKKNKINNHLYGLRLENGSSLQDQTQGFQGNGNSFAGAACDSEAITRQTGRITKFYYANTNSIYLPNPRWPNSSLSAWWFPITGFPSSLWENNTCGTTTSSSGGGGGSPISIGIYKDVLVSSATANMYNPLGINNAPITGIDLSVIDTSILTNTMVVGAFQTEQLWQFRLELFNKLKPYEADYLDTSIFRDYILQMEDGTINEFSQINVIETQIEEEMSELAIQLDQSYQKIDSLNNLLRIYDSIITHDSTSISVRIATKAQKASLNVERRVQDSIYHALVSALDTSYAEQVSSIESIIDTIVPEGVSDSLKLEFTRVYYETYGAMNTVINPSQYEVYASLANHCPMKNYDVVYRSRAVVHQYNDSIEYNDSILCSEIGITLKQAKPIQYAKKFPEIVSYSVFPNPTKGMATIHFSQIPSLPITIVVTDLLGREVYRETVSFQSNIYPMDTRGWNQGIYSLRLMNGNQELYHTQIQVMK